MMVFDEEVNLENKSVTIVELMGNSVTVTKSINNYSETAIDNDLETDTSKVTFFAILQHKCAICFVQSRRIAIKTDEHSAPCSNYDISACE